MFAVIEFMGSDGETNQEISIVPLLWLQKNDTKCYWPIKTNRIPFEEFVKQETPFKKSWPLYKVFRVHFKTASYDQAEQKLKIVLNEAEGHSTDHSNRSLSQKRPISSCDSSSDSSDSEPQKKRIDNNHNHNNNFETSEPSEVNCQNNLQKDPTVNESAIPSFSTLTTVTASPIPSSFSSVRSCSDFENSIMQILSKIQTDIDHQTIMINELINFNKSIMATKLVPPENIPNFPLKSLENFQAFEEVLGNETSVREYMTRRLAALGGSDPESLCRRMLRFTISNEVGMLFNWRGTDKLSFKMTKLMEVIYDAGKMNFPQNDKNDERIEKAVKEWLKFSKTRLNKKKT